MTAPPTDPATAARHGARTPPARLLLLLALLLLPGGCGSKVNEANYYRVGVGTPEDKVEEWLGPGRPVTLDAAAAPANAPRTAKHWSAGRLTITLLFENGKVVARKADGLVGGKSESFNWPEAATRPALPEGRAAKDGVRS